MIHKHSIGWVYKSSIWSESDEHSPSVYGIQNFFFPTGSLTALLFRNVTLSEYLCRQIKSDQALTSRVADPPGLAKSLPELALISQ